MIIRATQLVGIPMNFSTIIYLLTVQYIVILCYILYRVPTDRAVPPARSRA
jgi:hypothetical protein